jgi:hypothetical protein
MVNQEQLNEILQKHKDWLNDIEGGVQADLRGADLSGCDLRFANLENSYLKGANLKGADLSCCDLTFANLRGANLRGVNLRDADLRSTKGVIQWQSPVGMKRICYSVKHNDCVMHNLGCFWGDTDKAVTAIREKYGDDSLYEKFLLMQVEALEEE